MIAPCFIISISHGDFISLCLWTTDEMSELEPNIATACSNLDEKFVGISAFCNPNGFDTPRFANSSPNAFIRGKDTISIGESSPPASYFALDIERLTKKTLPFPPPLMLASVPYAGTNKVPFCLPPQ